MEDGVILFCGVSALSRRGCRGYKRAYRGFVDSSEPLARLDQRWPRITMVSDVQIYVPWQRTGTQLVFI